MGFNSGFKGLIHWKRGKYCSITEIYDSLRHQYLVQ